MSCGRKKCDPAIPDNSSSLGCFYSYTYVLRTHVVRRTTWLYFIITSLMCACFSPKKILVFESALVDLITNRDHFPIPLISCFPASLCVLIHEHTCAFRYRVSTSKAIAKSVHVSSTLSMTETFIQTPNLIIFSCKCMPHFADLKIFFLRVICDFFLHIDSFLFSPPRHRHLPGLYVLELVPGCEAHLDGRLKKDDQILEINGIDLSDGTQEQAAHIINVSLHSSHIVGLTCKIILFEYVHFHMNTLDFSPILRMLARAGLFLFAYEISVFRRLFSISRHT